MMTTTTKTLAFLLTAAAIGVGASHYEKPPCQSDESAVQIMGIPGAFCSPQCSSVGECPMDVPDGVESAPACALQSPQGGSYCAILCSPSSYTSKEGENGNECGPEMSCQLVPNSGGFGVCTYAEAKLLGETEEMAPLVVTPFL